MKRPSLARRRRPSLLVIHTSPSSVPIQVYSITPLPPAITLAQVRPHGVTMPRHRCSTKPIAHQRYATVVSMVILLQQRRRQVHATADDKHRTRIRLLSMVVMILSLVRPIATRLKSCPVTPSINQHHSNSNATFVDKSLVHLRRTTRTSPIITVESALNEKCLSRLNPVLLAPSL